MATYNGFRPGTGGLRSTGGGRAGKNEGRLNATAGLGDFINAERSRLFDGATPERRAQFKQAERRRDVYQAWNAVCANTREGKHVTGLHFVAERNELVVYTDGASWTQELTMMREIIRARMERAGAAVDSILVKTTRPNYRREA
ncbi:MAG: DciA family protein [Coriobacteriaceae bacterium]|nr:DciA family protein [Coriobacteriaceae bacterium]